MEKIIRLQDAKFKLNPNGSHETSIFIDKDIRSYLNLEDGEEYSFEIDKENILKALSFTYSFNKSIYIERNKQTPLDSDWFDNEYEKITKHFQTSSKYKVNVVGQKGGRTYFKSLGQESGFNIRNILIESHFKMDFNESKLRLYYSNEPYAIDSEEGLLRNDTDISLKSTQVNFSWSDFYNDIHSSGLILSENLIQRFIASLQTKPFVILTGLSGSGKTKLAEAFSIWITNKYSAKPIFKKGQKLPSKQAPYIVRHISDTNITVESEGKSWAISPMELIEYWVDVIDENNFNIDTDSQAIKEKVLKKYEGVMVYSKSHNSFHSVLKALALGFISSRDSALINPTFNNHVCMVAVGADWTNREPLLGYPNALIKDDYVRPESGVLDLILNAQEDSKNPYFLILDEMNMSHVERYFADFLSAMESVNSTISLHSGDQEWDGVPSQVTLPKNLFIIGTVNVDETTYMFSPKVLDRANVIEFKVSEFEMRKYFKFPDKPDMSSLVGKGVDMAQNFVLSTSSKKQKEGLSDMLIPFFNNLQSVGAEFGYRSASEMASFAYMFEQMGNNDNNAIDAAIAQKLLPKLHGSRNKLASTLEILARLCLNDGQEVFSEGTKFDDAKYPISYEKLERMHKRIMADGFTSFAEA